MFDGVALKRYGRQQQAKRSVPLKYFTLPGRRKGSLPWIVAIQDGVIGREQVFERFRILKSGNWVQLVFSVHPENFDEPQGAGKPLAEDVEVSVRVPSQRSSLVGPYDARRHAVAKAFVTCFTKELRLGKSFCTEGTRVKEPAWCVHNIVACKGPQ